MQYDGFVVKTARLLLTGSLGLALIAMTLIFAARARAAESAPRTQTVFTETGEGVTVTPYLRRGGREVLFVDLEDYKDAEKIYVNFTYMSGDTKRGVEANINPATRKADGSFGGKDYFRLRFDLATCSKNVCVYHSDNSKKIKDFVVTVKTTNKTGQVKEVTRVVTIK